MNRRQYMLNAVKDDGFFLKWANNGLENDREIVLTAVAQNGAALQFASEKCRSDPEVVWTAIESNVSALLYATEALLDSEDFMARIKNEHPNALEFAAFRDENDDTLDTKTEPLFNANTWERLKELKYVPDFGDEEFDEVEE